MVTNSIRDRLSGDEPLVGTFQILDSAMVSEMIGVAGMDFVVYDQEHGPLTAETTLRLSIGAQNAGVAPIVRVRENRASEIQRALDIGAAGVQVPQIETRADAEAAVEAARFGPIGERGLSQYVRAGEYVGSETYTQDENERTALILQVEGERGVENIEGILSVEGVDVVFLGPYDLSQSLGIPGQVTDERVEDLMREVCEQAIEADVTVGAFADSAALANEWIEAGVGYVTIGVEAGLFTNHLATVVEDVDRA